MTAISKFPFLFILSFSVFSSILINPPQPNLIIKPRLPYLPINILSSSYTNSLFTSRSLSYLIPMQTPLLPPYHYPILFQCSNLHLLYLSIIALSYSHAKPIYFTSLSLSYLIPMLKIPRTTASEYIQPNSSPYISHCCGGWKASQRLWNLHLRNQPSLPSTPFHREGAFRPFLLPTHISKQTNVYYRYYYLEGRQPRWSSTYATCVIKDRRKLGGHKTTDVQITSELEPSGRNCMEATA